MARPISNRDNYWSDDHRYVLAYLAEGVRDGVAREYGCWMEVWDLMIEGWLKALRKYPPEELHGNALAYARSAMWQYALRQIMGSREASPAADEPDGSCLCCSTRDDRSVDPATGLMVEEALAGMSRRDRGIVKARLFRGLTWIRIGKRAGYTGEEMARRYGLALESARRRMNAGIGR